MLTNINPKLPMRDKAATKDFYLDRLGFKELRDYGDYLLIAKDNIEIHFFEFKELDPKENYGQVYIRTNDIDQWYQSLLDNNTPIHPNGSLQIKPWGQKEFSLLDPDHNLLTFGQSTEMN
ncbi:MAG: VOC family protein [Leadbetterella sp.]|nr:VOC family protein [Leadbetterella sp.]